MTIILRVKTKKKKKTIIYLSVVTSCVLVAIQFHCLRMLNIMSLSKKNHLSCLCGKTANAVSDSVRYAIKYKYNYCMITIEIASSAFSNVIN